MKKGARTLSNETFLTQLHSVQFLGMLGDECTPQTRSHLFQVHKLKPEEEVIFFSNLGISTEKYLFKVDGFSELPRLDR